MVVAGARWGLTETCARMFWQHLTMVSSPPLCSQEEIGSVKKIFAFQSMCYVLLADQVLALTSLRKYADNGITPGDEF